MVNLSVLYPHKDGAPFDMDYYLTKHMPLVRERCGAAAKSMTVEQGLAGGAPDSPPGFSSRSVRSEIPGLRSSDADG